MNNLKSVKPSTFAAIALLVIMTLEYPYALHYLFYPLIYPYIVSCVLSPELAGMAVVAVWFFPLFGFEYWFLSKRRRMQEAKAELEQQQKEDRTPQP